MEVCVPGGHYPYHTLRLQMFDRAVAHALAAMKLEIWPRFVETDAAVLLRRVSDAFEQRIPFFKMYAEYCSNYVYAAQKLRAATPPRGPLLQSPRDACETRGQIPHEERPARDPHAVRCSKCRARAR